MERTPGAPATPDEPPPAPPSPVRYAVVTLTVAGVIALGFLLQLDADAYLVMGVPITAAFQLLVGRRPLRALWVREAPPFRLDREGVAIAALLAVMPVVRIVRAARADDWTGAVYGVVAIGGAVAAAYALRAMRGATVRQLGLCIATAGVIGLGFNVLGALKAAHFDYHAMLAQSSGVTGIESFLLYVPVVFVMEEVFFRGALDSYLHRPGAGTGWLSAFYLSALWGLWHLPIYFPDEGFAVIPSLLLVQIGLGVPFSIWWRRSGNLAVSGITHALNDAIRNAIV